MIPTRPLQDERRVVVPFAGVVQPLVAVGDVVTSGQPVAMIEALKMEAAITAPSAGTVRHLAIPHPRQADGGDLLLTLS